MIQAEDGKDRDHDDDDDDDSLEGAIARNLFRTDDDSSDDQGDEDNPPSKSSNSCPEKIRQEEEEKEPVFVQYTVMNILLEEQRVGGSIAQRLWPAAEYLARYVMDNYSRSSCNSGGDINGTRISQSVTPLPLCIIELGAGLGLTGLQLATHFPSCRVLLTDLPEAMPLLERNIALNQAKFKRSDASSSIVVRAQVLKWGDADDVEAALLWVREGQEQQDQQLLVIASDCVYYKELHDPLEKTLSQLLSSSSEKLRSSCLLAGMRRWKRDNYFYNTLGQRTKTATHELQCQCLQETVSRSDEGGRELIRVFGIEWKEKKSK